MPATFTVPYARLSAYSMTVNVVIPPSTVNVRNGSPAITSTAAIQIQRLVARTAPRRSPSRTMSCLSGGKRMCGISWCGSRCVGLVLPRRVYWPRNVVGSNEAFVPWRSTGVLRPGGGGTMLETELFALLEQTADAAYTVTEQGEICSWNRSAEQLFGYPASEVLGRHIEEVFDAYDALGTEPLVGGAATAVRHPASSGSGIPHFDLDVRTRSGARLWVNVSTIVFDNRRTGRRLLVRLARDITQVRRQAELFDRTREVARQLVDLVDEPPRHAPVEQLSEQELRILKHFAAGKNSTLIARKLRISPQTLRNHLHHINRKLRTHNRLEAVTHAQRRGLLE